MYFSYSSLRVLIIYRYVAFGIILLKQSDIGILLNRLHVSHECPLRLTLKSESTCQDVLYNHAHCLPRPMQKLHFKIDGVHVHNSRLYINFFRGILKPIYHFIEESAVPLLPYPAMVSTRQINTIYAVTSRHKTTNVRTASKYTILAQTIAYNLSGYLLIMYTRAVNSSDRDSLETIA